MDKRVLSNGAYTTDYQGTRQRECDSYKAVTQALIPSGSSVVDIGSGIGHHVKWMLAKGYQAHGVDGTPDIFAKSEGDVEHFDLSIHRRYRAAPFSASWGVCFEVGEHIPKEFESAVIQNITDLARSHLIITWAQHTDKGIGHVNCHHPGYVQAALQLRGWLFDEASTITACDVMAPKYANKVLVFHK